LLVTIKTDGSGTVIVKPDFNKGKEPYRRVPPARRPMGQHDSEEPESLKESGQVYHKADVLLLLLLCRIVTSGEKRDVWRLTVENVCTSMQPEEKEREQNMYRDVSPPPSGLLLLPQAPPAPSGSSCSLRLLLLPQCSSCSLSAPPAPSGLLLLPRGSSCSLGAPSAPSGLLLLPQAPPAPSGLLLLPRGSSCSLGAPPAPSDSSCSLRLLLLPGAPPAPSGLLLLLLLLQGVST